MVRFGATNFAGDGFSLVEVIVALMLLSAGLFGLTGAAAWSARTTRQADALETAVANAEDVLDSLAFATRPTSGKRIIANDTLEWIASTQGDGTRIDLHVGYFDGNQSRTLQLNPVRTPPALPTIGTQ